MLTKVTGRINFFSKASGLTLNLRRCERLAVHNSDLSITANIPVKNVFFLKKKNKVKYLN